MLKWTRRLWLCGLVLAFPADLRAEDTAQLRAYSVGLLDLETASRVVRGLLSPDGVVVEDRAQHRLIVSDRPEVHARVAAALRQLAVPARNVRITVTHEAEREDRHRAIELGRVDRRGALIRGGAGSRRTTGRTRQDIVVLSGGRASITVAEQVPYVEWLRVWGEPYGLWAPGIQWQEVGASLVVEPLVIDDDTLRLRLTPAFSHFIDRERRTTEVHQLTTEVVVKEGEELDLGGVPFRDEQFKERFFLGLGDSGTLQRVAIRVRAEVE